MPTRRHTSDDVLKAFELKADVDAQNAEVHRIDMDAVAKRSTAESAYQASVRRADVTREKSVDNAADKRDQEIERENDRVTEANDELVKAQKILDDFQDKLETDAGVRITLPGAPSASGTVRV